MSTSVSAFPVLATGCNATHWLELSPEFRTFPDWPISPLSASCSESCSVVWAAAGAAAPEASSTSARISVRVRRRLDELRISNKRPPSFYFYPLITRRGISNQRIAALTVYRQLFSQHLLEKPQ